MPTIDKNQFLQALSGFTEISGEEAKEVCTLKQSFPYSQVLHALAARLSKDHKMSSHQHDLQMAAVYSADRSVLKEVMIQVPAAWPSSHEVSGIQHPEIPSTIAAEEKSPVEIALPSEDLADRVMKDLRRLNILKHNFENMVEENSHVIIEENSLESEDNENSETKRKLPPGRKPGNIKAHRIVELAKALEIESEEGVSDDSDRPQGVEDIIESLKVSKKKIIPDSEKQREQIEIIEQFIKAQPSISPAKSKTSAGSEDFNTIKSGEFGENVISETLVDILLQQGKKDKAVEVLKKLIWKFPQKKAYFAAQIEELKK